MSTLRTLGRDELDDRWRRVQARIDDILAREVDPPTDLLHAEDALLAEFDRRDREVGCGRWSDDGWAE